MKLPLIALALVVTLALPAGAGSKRSKPVEPSHATVTFMGFHFLMKRMDCDYKGNGAARLDTCAVDGMAAGGSNSGTRNKKK